MIAILAGLPGQMKTLIDRLTSTRAGNLDNITATRMAKVDTIDTNVDATVSSRASQSSLDVVDGIVDTVNTNTAATASNVTTLTNRLTSARAGYLDNLETIPGGRSPVAMLFSDTTWTSSDWLSNTPSSASYEDLDDMYKLTASGQAATWTEIGSITGPGVITSLMLRVRNANSTYACGCRIKIDGTELFSVSLVQVDSAIQYYPIIGNLLPQDFPVDQYTRYVMSDGHGIPFKSSFVVEGYATAPSGDIRGAYMRGFRT